MKKYQIVKLHYQFFSVRLDGKEIAVANSFREANRMIKKLLTNRTNIKNNK